MRTYYGWTITKNEECRAYPWNIYDKDGEYVCSCATLKEAKDSIKASEGKGQRGLNNV